jgi:hypothetical protein
VTSPTASKTRDKQVTEEEHRKARRAMVRCDDFPVSAIINWIWIWFRLTEPACDVARTIVQTARPRRRRGDG